MVPYKYHFSGSREFGGSATIGPDFGYRSEKNSYGFGLKYIAFLGAGTVSVTQNVDGVATKQSLSSFSYGVGVLGEIKQDFQWGLVFGRDRVSGASKFPDNGKTWVAIALGYSFSN